MKSAKLQLYLSRSGMFVIGVILIAAAILLTSVCYLKIEWSTNDINNVLKSLRAEMAANKTSTEQAVAQVTEKVDEVNHEMDDVRGQLDSVNADIASISDRLNLLEADIQVKR